MQEKGAGKARRALNPKSILRTHMEVHVIKRLSILYVFLNADGVPDSASHSRDSSTQDIVIRIQYYDTTILQIVRTHRRQINQSQSNLT
jgi:hypothetical protein